MNHPVARRELGEVSTCAQLRVVGAGRDGNFKKITGILSAV